MGGFDQRQHQSRRPPTGINAILVEKYGYEWTWCCVQTWYSSRACCTGPVPGGGMGGFPGGDMGGLSQRLVVTPGGFDQRPAVTWVDLSQCLVVTWVVGQRPAVTWVVEPAPGGDMGGMSPWW